jgi:hypothetical protein
MRSHCGVSSALSLSSSFPPNFKLNRPCVDTFWKRKEELTFSKFPDRESRGGRKAPKSKESVSQRTEQHTNHFITSNFTSFCANDSKMRQLHAGQLRYQVRHSERLASKTNGPDNFQVAHQLLPHRNVYILPIESVETILQCCARYQRTAQSPCPSFDQVLLAFLYCAIKF